MIVQSDADEHARTKLWTSRFLHAPDRMLVAQLDAIDLYVGVSSDLATHELLGCPRLCHRNEDCILWPHGFHIGAPFRRTVDALVFVDRLGVSSSAARGVAMFA